MSKEQILSWIGSLSMSQGFYSRLYKQLTNGSEESESFLNLMVDQHFNDVVDMVIWLES